MSNFLSGIAFLLFSYYLLIAPFVTLAKIKKSNATRLDSNKLKKAKQADGSYLFQEPALVRYGRLAKYIFFIVLIVNLLVLPNINTFKWWSYSIILLICIPSLLNIYSYVVNFKNFIRLNNNVLQLKTRRELQEIKLDEIAHAELIFTKPTAYSLSTILELSDASQQKSKWTLSDMKLQFFANEILAALQENKPEIITGKNYL